MKELDYVHKYFLHIFHDSLTERSSVCITSLKDNIQGKSRRIANFLNR